MFQALIGPIANLAGTWFQNKLEKTKADGQAKVAEAKARATVAEKVAAGEVEWEGKMAQASDNSWKDEAWTLTFIAIILASFIPALQPFMKQGFIFLKNDCPDWISYGILASIAGSFGLKSIAQFRK